MSLLGIEALVRSMLLVSWTRAIEGGGGGFMDGRCRCLRALRFFPPMVGTLMLCKDETQQILYVFFQKNTQENIEVIH